MPTKSTTVSTTISTTNSGSGSLSDTIAKYSDKLVTARINSAPYDKTYAGIISDILFEPDTKTTDAKFGKYKVRYNNIEKTFKLNDGLVHAIGERVTVYVPENNPNRMYAEPVIKRMIPYKIVYDDDPESEDNKKSEDDEAGIDTVSFTEYRKVKTKGKVYELESKYKLKVKNKDTAYEEVTKMLCPDGSVIEFVNWDMD